MVTGPSSQHCSTIMLVLLLALFDKSHCSTNGVGAISSSSRSTLVFNNKNKVPNGPRILQEEEEYQKPPWWRRYRKIMKKQLKKCKRYAHEFPVNGERCPSRKKFINSTYTCLFGSQETCSDGQAHPSLQCDCQHDDTAATPKEEWKWSCKTFEPECNPITACPVNPPETGFKCPAFDGNTCHYGTETCCGKEHPKYTCSCYGDTFACEYNNYCLGSTLPSGCDYEEEEQEPTQEELSCPAATEGIIDAAAWNECKDGANSPPCQYDGTYDCCGVDKHESNGMTVQCVNGEIMTTSSTTTCPDCAANDDRCPTKAPDIGNMECSLELEGTSCTWGKSECCGALLDEYHCNCSGGQWCCATPGCYCP